MIAIKVLRYDPAKDEKPYYETYEVEETEKMKVLDALNYINQKYGAGIAYRCSCRAGQCGSCALKVNSEVKLACKAEIEDNAVIEPLDFDVLKDLVVDRSEIENKIKKMKLSLRGDEVHQDSEMCLEILKPEQYEDSKKLRGCIECFSCLSACPVVNKTSAEYAGPYFMRDISKFALDPRNKEERAKLGLDEGLYCCTTCGKCAEVCPKEISTVGGAIEKLREIACREGVGPLPAHKEVKELIARTGRSVELLDEGFIKAVSGKNKEKSNIAFFTGCLVDYRQQEVGFALLKVLENHNIDIVVPEDQVCCGSPMIRTGQTDIVKELAQKNKEVFKDYDTIITVCAGCGATLKKDYPKLGVNFNVVDISEFLIDNLNTEDMKPLNMKVTYHDPCHLNRVQGINKEPREILKKIKGLELVEMEKPNQCCGAGGGVRAGKPEIASELGKEKAEMIKKLGVDAVVTICPFCQINIETELKKEGINIPVLNILKLLEMAYEK
ncbi:fumarate reductase (CoM/CoB) subunit TfrB [Methanobacterium sp.]|jgi:fumarate reductase (CoM/CoB) subunit B|uniref:fumarate reductase (CoM/CoB) subunit TfrB n=1 Tax=Methanobacterium sp. TaxID=2164 RepID=UPI003159408E